MAVVIHCEPAVRWQGPFAEKMQSGLSALGIHSKISPSRVREADTSILLGTTFWRDIEASGDYLLVDRCSFFNTDEWVSLVWNGHGRRGDHKVPENVKSRKHPEIMPWVSGNRIVLCGQESLYSPNYQSLQEWYDSVEATHFRKHPTAHNTTGLPSVKDWKDCDLAITLNSSIGVDSLIRGIPTVTMDEGAMAWDATGHNPNQPRYCDRRPWLEWMSWTQWHHDEIRDGHPIRHLFEEI